MIIADFEQLSPEWFNAKAGLISATGLKRILTSKGVPSKSQKDYMYQLAGETVVGNREESYQSGAMLRGIEMQKRAGATYAWDHGEVREVGLCWKDETKRIGCSPDGLVGENGGLEIKCPGIQVHTKYKWFKTLPSEYFHQVQGNLYVTGREWWDFYSYHPDDTPFLIRVYPDESFLACLDETLKTFLHELDTMIAIKREEEANGVFDGYVTLPIPKQITKPVLGTAPSVTTEPQTSQTPTRRTL